jgi:SHS family lactate transporter-like MFS transporter
MTQDEYNTRAPHEGMSPGRYAATRFSSLKPPMHNVPNPIKLLRMLNSQQWSFFFIAFVAWVRLNGFSITALLRVTN